SIGIPINGEAHAGSRRGRGRTPSRASNRDGAQREQATPTGKGTERGRGSLHVRLVGVWSRTVDNRRSPPTPRAGVDGLELRHAGQERLPLRRLPGVFVRLVGPPVRLSSSPLRPLVS